MRPRFHPIRNLLALLLLVVHGGVIGQPAPAAPTQQQMKDLNEAIKNNPLVPGKMIKLPMPASLRDNRHLNSDHGERRRI